MLCIQRTLNKGRWPAFFTGVGAALSDLIYCLLTGLCLSFITDFVETNQLLLQIIGSLVLAAFAFYLFRKNPARSLSTPSEQANTYWKDFVTGFLLTFSNPLILFFIIGLFARFSFLDLPTSGLHYVLGFACIAAGAIGWWTGITYLIDKIRGRFTVRSMKRINRAIAIFVLLMAAFGIYDSLGSLLF